LAFAKSLLWRYYLDNNKELKLITTKNYKNLVGKDIQLRSPIYCICSDGICKTCYGKSSEVLNIKNLLI
jgi:hypothetical protein